MIFSDSGSFSFTRSYTRIKFFRQTFRSPFVSGRLESNPIFFLSMAASKLSVVSTRPSAVFFASVGIIQLHLSQVTPDIFPSEQSMRTRLSEIPIFQQSAPPLYIKIPPLFGK